MYSQPLVSILVNNYNYSQYLSLAIDSAINQTYPQLEIIVVDDGSTDNSHQIINSYQDKIVAVFKKNGGQASALNAGFAVSKGEIICLLDVDDLWLPSKVQEVVEAFNNHSQAAVVYHKVQNIDQNGFQSDKPPKYDKPWPHYRAITGNIRTQVSKTGGWWPFPPSTALSFSRKFLIKVMDIPESEYRLCADAYLADLAPFFGEVIGIERVLSQYRLHNSNNWSHSPDSQQRSNQHLQVRVANVNRVLAESGLDLEISLEKRWPYQLTEYKLGKPKNLIHLSYLAWSNPWEHRITSKIKTVIKLWLERIGIGSSRL